MIDRSRVVVDTNVLISRLLAPNSVPGQAVSHAVRQGRLLASDATLEELAEVLGRAKFDRYLTLDERQQFVRLSARIVDIPAITHRFNDCRDASDKDFSTWRSVGQPALSSAETATCSSSSTPSVIFQS